MQHTRSLAPSILCFSLLVSAVKAEQLAPAASTAGAQTKTGKIEVPIPTEPLEARLPPVFAYTQRTEQDGLPVLTAICLRQGGRAPGLLVEAMSGVDLVFRAGGGRVSRGHFLPYVEAQGVHSCVVCVDGLAVDPRWLSIIHDRAYAVMLRRSMLAMIYPRQPKQPLPPELGYVTVLEGAPTLVVLRLVDTREALPKVELDGLRETPEGTEKNVFKSVAQRFPLEGLTAATVKGDAVSHEQLAKSSASGPLPVAVLPQGKTLNPFWQPILIPTGFVVMGIPAEDSTKK